MTEPLRIICVGTVTRNRPIMLQALLDSYAAMTTPAHTKLVFVIVENNETATLRSIIERFRAKVPGCVVDYDIEPRLGIAFVRNRVLDNAIASGCDLLTFADDDEVVEPDWLVQLLAERDTADLDIVGSPVRIAPAGGMSVWENIVWTGLNNAARKYERRDIAIKANGQANRIRIATGSWLGKLQFFRSTGLRFEEKLGLNGGEDWWLYHSAKKAGAKTGWAPQAIAYETIPEERLKLAYYFKRSRNHCAIETRTRWAKKPIYTLWRMPGSILARLFKLIVQLAVMPFAPCESLLMMTKHLGGIAGMLQAFTPHASPHYQKTTGY